MKNPFAKSVPPPKEEPNDSTASVETIYRMDWDRVYPQSLERVWNAISNADEISAWMKFPTQLEPSTGGKIHIAFSAEGSLEGIVCEFEAPHLLVFTWGDSLVNWKLEGTGEQTKLRFSHVGVRPELLAGLGAGWHRFLDQLEDHLAGSTRPDRYQELKARYENAGKP